MSWEPPPRPAWVAAVNNGLIEPITELARRPLSAEALVGGVSMVLGLARATSMRWLGDDATEALVELMTALEDEADLTLTGRWLAHTMLERLVTARLHVAQYAQSDPGVRDEVVREPVFVTGWLAPDNSPPGTPDRVTEAFERRAELWELEWPLPPGSSENDGRPARTASETGRGQRHEDLDGAALLASFRSPHFADRFHVPSYSAWLAKSGMDPAYAWHRSLLQVRQRHSEPLPWRLESPIHIHHLEALRGAFPDAAVIVRHGDPLEALRVEVTRLAEIRWAHSQYVDLDRLGASIADRYIRTSDRLVSGRDDARTTHLPAVAGPPVAGPPVAGPAAAAQPRPGVAGQPSTARSTEREHGRLCTFDDMGLDGEGLRARFARYRGCFEMPHSG